MTPEQLAEWRKEFERRTMTSAIWEYCPEEFGVLLDEVDRLNAALAAAFERGREEEREAWKELALQQALHRARETTEGATDDSD